jgi:regulatory factor X
MTGKPPAHIPRPSHLRARAAASPYARDSDSLYSSSSETEDLSVFLSHGAPQDYSYAHHHQQQHAPQMQHYPPHHQHHLGPEAVGAFGRMTLSPDHALEQLAANVRSATTTSSSDRAKQIFVQAW